MLLKTVQGGSPESVREHITDEVAVGKDILELLAGAMYADPLTIYREYIQNAADSIDLARAAGLDPGAGFGVQVSIDMNTRSVLIRDNGVSIPQRAFIRRLTSIGASTKRGKGLRGFRGVGRLSGLGYCQELIFRGRAEGDKDVTELRWDGRELRTLLRDGDYAGDLQSLIRSVVDVQKLPPGIFPSRFFEVELRKLSRLRGDLLLNDQTIRHYLSQVSPVPFHPEFDQGDRIAKFLKERGVRDPIELRVHGDADPIYHRARSSIPFSEKSVDKVANVEFLEFRGQDGEVEAFGWLLDHAYLGSIPKRSGLGGIRLRAGDIQVGDETALSPLFAEARFSQWALGDIHIASPRILPNARRDDFEATVHYAHLQDELMLLTKRVSQTIRDRSASRNRLRKARSHLSLADQWVYEAATEKLPQSVADRVSSIVDGHIKEAERELGKLTGSGAEVRAIEAGIKKTTQERMKASMLVTRAAKTRKTPKDKAIDITLNIILEHASSPHAGLAMSRRILSALDATT